ncbi:formylglycine-generating enzyme family protein, partial [Rubrivirga sp.]|uniref:formylglycine-generating enzyme family protein n=1 Tax=Rubrivirga sp. TaxID=1885344 RepID=UPI003C7888E1
MILALGLAGCATDAEADPTSRASAVASRTEEPERVRAVALEVETPDGMVGVPGGTTTIGVLEGEGGMAHEKPAFKADVGPFFLDRSPVTVERFRAFVDATGFETQAEGFGDGTVMDQATGQWGLVPGANWKTPFGSGL